MSFWREYFDAIGAVLDAPRPLVVLFGVLPVLFFVAVVVQTWFIWAGLIVAALLMLFALWVIECALRLRHCLHGSNGQPTCVSEGTSCKRTPPEPMRTKCADAQGRILSADISSDYVSAMAHQILAGAVVRPTTVSAPSWLQFPAISQAAPRLARFVQLVVRLCTQ